jgi:hypothetical protein
MVTSSTLLVFWFLSTRVASAETDEASNESVIVTKRKRELIIFVETEPER